MLELLETVYASNTVSHIRSGNAIVRAVRGHCLVGTAHHMLLISNIFGTELPKTSQDGCALNDDSFTAADELDTNPAEGDQTLPDALKDANKIRDDLLGGIVWYGYYETVRQQRWTWQCKNILLSATKPASNTKTHLLLEWQRMCPTPITWFITCPQDTHSQINLSCSAWPLGSLQMSQSMLTRHLTLENISSEHDW